MTHPITPDILTLAAPLADSVGLEVVGATFHTNYSPPVLRIDVRNPDGDTSLDDCERMSRVLEPALDESDLIPDAYVLEISSPGISSLLTTDREFTSFKGFPVTAWLTQPISGQKRLSGQLIRRDEEKVYLNRKGKVVGIPRSAIAKVQLEDGKPDS